MLQSNPASRSREIAKSTTPLNLIFSAILFNFSIAFTNFIRLIIFSFVVAYPLTASGISNFNFSDFWNYLSAITAGSATFNIIPILIGTIADIIKGKNHFAAITKASVCARQKVKDIDYSPYLTFFKRFIYSDALAWIMILIYGAFVFDVPNDKLSNLFSIVLTSVTGSYIIGFTGNALYNQIYPSTDSFKTAQFNKTLHYMNAVIDMYGDHGEHPVATVSRILTTGYRGPVPDHLTLPAPHQTQRQQLHP